MNARYCSFIQFITLLSICTRAATKQNVVVEDDDDSTISLLERELIMPGTLLQNEIKWAQDSMEMYHRQKHKFPLRSSLEGSPQNIHTEQWEEKSLEHLLQVKEKEDESTMKNIDDNNNEDDDDSLLVVPVKEKSEPDSSLYLRRGEKK